MRIEGAAGVYVVVADSSYGATYRGQFRDAIDRSEIERLQLALRRETTRDIGGTEASDAAATAEALVLIERFGRTLFDTVFAGELESGLRDTMALAQRDGRPLRIRLRLESVPELGPLPWELLRDGERGRFVALSGQTDIVRHLGRPEPVRRVELHGPLRVLVVVSSPTDLPPISAEGEWAALAAELEPLVSRGRLELARMDPPTFDELRQRLLDGPWHVLHFIGHGDQAPASLAFCRPDGRADLIGADALAVALADTVELRLAVLNVCHSARASERDAFGGVAQELIEHSVPAVVAMQFAVSDRAALLFAARFYAAVTHGWTVDRAAGDARRLLAESGGEWATPVVHLRGDGVLFDLAPTPPGPGKKRRSGIMIAVAAAIVVLVGSATWLIVRRTADSGGTSTSLPSCPTVDTTWNHPSLAAEPSGTFAIDEGEIGVAARDVAWRPEGARWLVVTEVAITNSTPGTFYIGAYRLPLLVVANRQFPITCYDSTGDLIAQDRTADARAGYEVSCEPQGLIQLVAGDDENVTFPLTASTTPSAC